MYMLFYVFVLMVVLKDGKIQLRLIVFLMFKQRDIHFKSKSSLILKTISYAAAVSSVNLAGSAE